MQSLIDDISLLTDVSENTLNKFLPVVISSIGHAVHEATCSKQDTTEIDIGFGELHIKIEHDTVKYRFIPSKTLEKTVINTLLTKESPIVTKINNSLQEKIDRTYKELL